MVESPTVAIEEEPWEPDPLPFAPYMPSPTIHSRVHILAPDPSVTFNPLTYPTIEFGEHSGPDVEYASVVVTLIGTAEQRRAFAERLHEVASSIARWTEADGRAPEVES